MMDRSRGTTSPLVAALELTASEQPELLPWLIEVVWNSAALQGIAVQRSCRACVRTRRRRLETIARRVADELETERQRGWIQKFIGVAAPGVETVHADEGRPIL